MNVSTGSNRVHRPGPPNSFDQTTALCNGARAHRLYETEAQANCRKCDDALIAEQNKPSAERIAELHPAANAMKRATEVARFIVDTRIAIAAQGDLAMIDNYLTGGIELAHMVTSGYIGQLSASGELRLTTTYDRIKALREALSRPIEPTGFVECTTPDGTRLVLVYTEHGIDGTPVSVGEEIRESGDDEPFIVTGATWRDDIDETAPCVVGQWDSHPPCETYPISARGFRVRWIAQL